MVTTAPVKLVLEDPILGSTYGNGFLHINFPRHEIWGKPENEWERIELTPTEFRLLIVFLRHPGLVLSRNHLADLVWPDEDAMPENIRFHVNRLRHKIGESLIENVRSFGYRYVGHELAEGEKPS